MPAIGFKRGAPPCKTRNQFHARFVTQLLAPAADYNVCVLSEVGSSHHMRSAFDGQSRRAAPSTGLDNVIPLLHFDNSRKADLAGVGLVTSIVVIAA